MPGEHRNEHDALEARRRRGVRVTAGALAALATLFYVGFIVVNW